MKLNVFNALQIKQFNPKSRADVELLERFQRPLHQLGHWLAGSVSSTRPVVLLCQNQSLLDRQLFEARPPRPPLSFSDKPAFDTSVWTRLPSRRRPLCPPPPTIRSICDFHAEGPAHRGQRPGVGSLPTQSLQLSQ